MVDLILLITFTTSPDLLYNTTDMDSSGSYDKPVLFGDFFNLHPIDAQNQIVRIDRALEDFTYAFKDRIEVEIDYAKGLLKVGKLLQKYIDPERPSPLSYISSAFKVAHEQRARHALELSQYLHTEIEVICQNLLKEHMGEAKRVDRQLKDLYYQGQNAQESYQKALKKYHRMKEQWEEKMMSNTITLFNPAVAQKQRNKAALKLEDQRKSLQAYRERYIVELQKFNAFADKYNKEVVEVIKSLEQRGMSGVSAQADSMRKLIVSEVNMFKNIEYDLLNVSKQMEVVKPGQELELITQELKDSFSMPIIEIYAQGPASQSSYGEIDLKQPVSSTLLESSLKGIDQGHLFRMQANRTDSTLMYCVERACRRAEGLQAQDESDFMEEFEDAVVNNKIVTQMPKNGTSQYLSTAEAATVSYQVVIWVACYLRQEGIIAETRQQMSLKIKNYLSQHHFYRFLAVMALQKSQVYEQGKLKDSQEHYIPLLKIILEESYESRDIFVIRETLTLIFSSTLRVGQEDEIPFYRCETLVNLQVWQRLDFWYAAVFESSYEEISNLPIGDKLELKEVFLMRQKNLVFSGLATYCHYMAMLGQEEKQIRTIMGRFARLYSLLDEHERDLARTIVSSVKKHSSVSLVP